MESPTPEELADLCRSFGLEVNDPAALGWLVVTALAIWGDAQDPAAAPAHEV